MLDAFGHGRHGKQAVELLQAGFGFGQEFGVEAGAVEFEIFADTDNLLFSQLGGLVARLQIHCGGLGGTGDFAAAQSAEHTFHHVVPPVAFGFDVGTVFD